MRQGVTVFTFDVLSKNRAGLSTEFGNADEEIQQKLASFEFYKVFPNFSLIQIEITVFW